MGKATETVEALARMNSTNMLFLKQFYNDKIQYNGKWYTRKQLGNLLSKPARTRDLGEKA